MYLAGIDEAGLGPKLGSLTVAATLLHTATAVTPAAPWELWPWTRLAAEKSLPENLPVADSKIAYQQGGVAALEKTVLAFYLAAGGKLPSSGQDFLTLQAAKPPAAGAWFSPQRLHLPLYNELAALSAAAAKLREAPLKVCGLWPLVWPAAELNRRFAAGANKAEVLQAATRRLIAKLRQVAVADDVLLVIDRQGGRKFYGAFLAEIFGALPQIITEEAAVSIYQIDRWRIVFQTKADRSAFAPALASMLAKYCREIFLAQLNNYFCQRLPDLKPTAGYPVDAKRFFAAVEATCQSEKIPPAQLWRQR